MSLLGLHGLGLEGLLEVAYREAAQPAAVDVVEELDHLLPQLLAGRRVIHLLVGTRQVLAPRNSVRIAGLKALRGLY